MVQAWDESGVEWTLMILEDNSTEAAKPREVGAKLKTPEVCEMLVNHKSEGSAALFPPSLCSSFFTQAQRVASMS